MRGSGGTGAPRHFESIRGNPRPPRFFLISAAKGTAHSSGCLHDQSNKVEEGGGGGQLDLLLQSLDLADVCFDRLLVFDGTLRGCARERGARRVRMRIGSTNTATTTRDGADRQHARDTVKKHTARQCGGGGDSWGSSNFRVLGTVRA